MIKFCPQCNKNKHTEYCGVEGYYWSYLETAEKCNECGEKFTNIDFPALDLKTLCYISKDVTFIEAMIQLRKDNIIEYETKMAQFRTQVKQQESIKQQSAPSKPKCPTCGSTNIKKISNTKRWIGVGLFGLASSDVGKSMVCGSCGYKW